MKVRQLDADAPDFEAALAALHRRRHGARSRHRRPGGRHPGRGAASAATRRCSSTRTASTASQRPPSRSSRSAPARMQAALDALAQADRAALQEAARAHPPFPRTAARVRLEPGRVRRHDPGPARDAARPRRHLRAGRQGLLSVVRADERHPRPRGGRRRDRHGGAGAGRRAQSAGAGGGGAGRRHPRVLDRRRPGGGGAGLRHGDGARRRQDRRAGQRLRRRGQAPRVRHGRHRHGRRAERDPRHWRRPYRPRLDRHGPVFAGRARRNGAIHPAHAPIAPIATRCRRPSPACCPRCRGAPSSRPRWPGVRPSYSCAISNRPARSPTASPRSIWRSPPPSRAAGSTHIRHAGSIFLGSFTSEALGDYCAGPNHVLPTSRTARFSSPLGVGDFQKRSSVIEVTAAGARRLGPVAARLARGEGLDAHARSAEMRLAEPGAGARR